MSVPITIGYFDKRVNSTKKNGFNGTDCSGVLKDPCDIYNPTFKVRITPDNFNYCKASFTNGDIYYWVDKVVSFPNGICEVTCHIDPLATYQDDIKSGYAFCVYADSTNWNKEIDDPRMQPEKIDRTNSTSKDIFPFTMVKTNGTVIVTVMQCGIEGDQGICTYALTISQFKSCLAQMYNVLKSHHDTSSSTAGDIVSLASGLTGVQEISNYLAGGFSVILSDLQVYLSHIIADVGGIGGWRDNLIRALYTPIPHSYYANIGESKDMYLGAIKCGSYTRIPSCYIEQNNDSLPLTWCTKNTAQTRFLCYPRFQSFQVNLFGGYYQSLDSMRLKDHIGSGNTNLHYYSSIDVVSGDWSCVINENSNLDSEKLASFSGNCSFDITGLAGRGGMGGRVAVQTGGLKLAGNILSMGLANDAISGVMDESSPNANFALKASTGIAQNFLNNGMSGCASGVAGGGISSMFLSGTDVGKIDIACVAFYPEMLDTAGSYVDYCTKYGYPCNKYLPLFNVAWNSYVQCSGASIETTATQTIQAYINQALNSGIYLEQ